ncbi:sulfur carrier protein ThiS [Iodobacter fluviatilis]|uniref:Sulfur carrier protein ThiS n=1 Tax=Iodobacter fluviatilis TaxID=537 RepID=A0A377Q2K7_9NEIS|nr:sulfur carrier protein ThiS [Iodobacter fluviatilis]TCU90387.1 sulfur carrier protein ThiS [Iodobacter fluviatilis]STQ89414.1 sulfur carrier protein ThiS [Iodobacter fluviatilis]
MKISINGEAREFLAPLSLLDLIDLLELKGKRIAIEQNGEIVPKSQHGTTFLSEGDVLEMVVAVGGG